MRPVLLDLFCGAGGAAVGYYQAGFDVVGVDISPQPNYPFEFVQCDALYYLEEVVLPFDGHGFTAMHASPPCQRYTGLAKGNNGNVEDYPDLLPPTRESLDKIGLPYVIENVMGAPMRQDLMLCGLQFGLKVFRHRQFELGGWKIENPMTHPSHKGHRVFGYRHGKYYDGDMYGVYGTPGDRGSVADWQRAMGIDWTSIRKEIAEAIPPAYTEHIGIRLLEHVTSEERISE